MNTASIGVSNIPNALQNGKPAPVNVDSIRERELYQYYQPVTSPTSNGTTDSRGISETGDAAAPPPSSPDTTLTALAQLCALRLQAQRAMISVIGREKQYFIAEATKTVSISDTSRYEEEGDGLWAGCATVKKEGRLCERTLEATADPNKYAMFTVTNMQDDPRFANLPFVCGPPYFKFYAGTPLTTKRGISIGSLFILDDLARPALSPDQVDFLGTMATVVMKHMEVTAEAEERKKVLRLSTGMNAFVEGRSRLASHNNPEGSGRRRPRKDATPLVAGRRSSGKENVAFQEQRNDSNANPPHLPNYNLNLIKEASFSDSSYDSDYNAEAKSSDTSHQSALNRATNILYDALDLRGRGGVVFLDTTARHRRRTGPPRNSYTEALESKPVEVMTATTGDLASSAAPQLSTNKSFKPLDSDYLHSLLHRYPRGKLWTFDGDTAMSSSDEGAKVSNSAENDGGSDLNRVKRKQADAARLRQHFPGVSQLLFYGLWDGASNRWFTAGFAWTTSKRQVFSVETELNYFMAFGNSVMAQVSRLASMAADRQKADFIGSISHELRSPLHGILASAEFLAETHQDNFQESLVDTIASCGRTLLDTINHILDYSKINSFERNWKATKRARSRFRGAVKSSGGAGDKDTPPMLNIYAVTDVSSIAEEVVEGVYAGQVYQDISSTDAVSLSSASQAAAQDRGVRFSTELKKRTMVKDIEVILDIDHDDYVFVTQPGALKRVIMNVFGNALKYTQQGSITIKMSLDGGQSSQREPVTEVVNERVLQIVITDTGKGISREYLRNSLFSPFSQEDVLASGTGLGLSIVKSIVTMLQGTIDVQSEQGIGTEVTVRVPMSRIPGNNTPVDTPSSTADSKSDDAMNSLIRDHQDSTISLYGFGSDSGRIGIVLQHTIEEWFGLRVNSYGKESRESTSSLIMTDERHLASLLPSVPRDVPLVVLCNNSTRSEIMKALPTHQIAEIVSKPFGPHKLAKALRFCLDRAHDVKHGLAAPDSTNYLEALISDEVTPMPVQRDPRSEDVLPDLYHLTLETADPVAPIEVTTNESITARNSENALRAIAATSSSNATSDNATVTGEDDFPFPSRATSPQSPVSPIANEPTRSLRRPMPDRRVTEPITRVMFTSTSSEKLKATSAALLGHPQPPDLDTAKSVILTDSNVLSLSTQNVALLNAHNPQAIPRKNVVDHVKRTPKLLLVDDNQINLRLLQTCMKKRKYQEVHTAENGQLAVRAAEAHGDGYDIIFMDISMPVMNGFEATRAIRDMEDERGGISKNGAERHPALIIAITGLASSRDQTEAFASGVDLFLTKPVSFKEVGKLLDNWETHGGLKPPAGESGDASMSHLDGNADQRNGERR